VPVDAAGHQVLNGCLDTPKSPHCQANRAFNSRTLSL
jgi:hypothetical protein